MRPVNKGIAPNVYSDYRDAFQDIVAAIGPYCSYCERKIETHLAVEHKQPQNHAPLLKNDWSNFLLACVNCNSCKGRQEIVLNNYLWPDTDNTLFALKYTLGGIIEINKSLSNNIQTLAEKTLELTGLDKYPGNSNPKKIPSRSDLRWQRRREIFDSAEKLKTRLESNNTMEMRETIVEFALAHGMFSIWWTVFDHDTDMRRRFKEAFLGTELQCFDGIENLQPRQGGHT